MQVTNVVLGQYRDSDGFTVTISINHTLFLNAMAGNIYTFHGGSALTSVANSTAFCYVSKDVPGMPVVTSASMIIATPGASWALTGKQ
jgi:hypothetical protein